MSRRTHATWRTRETREYQQFVAAHGRPRGGRAAWRLAQHKRPPPPAPIPKEVADAAIMARSRGIPQEVIYRTLRDDLKNPPTRAQLRDLWQSHHLLERRDVNASVRAIPKDRVSYREKVREYRLYRPGGVKNYQRHAVESAIMSAGVPTSMMKNQRMVDYLENEYMTGALWY